MNEDNGLIIPEVKKLQKKWSYDEDTQIHTCIWQDGSIETYDNKLIHESNKPFLIQHGTKQRIVDKIDNEDTVDDQKATVRHEHDRLQIEDGHKREGGRKPAEKLSASILRLAEAQLEKKEINQDMYDSAVVTSEMFKTQGK